MLDMSVAGAIDLGIKSQFFEQSNEAKWYPYQIVTRHELLNPDYVKRFQFSQWFLNQCNR